MNAEFNWWLLIVGLVAGAGLVWFVLMDTRRDEADVDAAELEREAIWLAAALRDEGYDMPPEAAERALTLHREYLEAPPPDEPSPDDDLAAPDLDASEDADRKPAPGSERAGDDRLAIGP